MTNIRVICIPLEKHLIITVNKNASSTLFELIGVGNQIFCSSVDLPTIIDSQPHKQIVGVLREPLNRFTSGLIEEIKRTIKSYADLFNLSQARLEHVAQTDDFWISAAKAYFVTQGSCTPTWGHASMSYACHCGNWLDVLEQMLLTTDVKLVHMDDLTQFLSELGYADVKLHNNTAGSDYIIRLNISVPALHKRFANDILPQLAEYDTIKDHLDPEIQTYNRLMQHARSQN